MDPDNPETESANAVTALVALPLRPPAAPEELEELEDPTAPTAPSDKLELDAPTTQPSVPVVTALAEEPSTVVERMLSVVFMMMS